MVGRAARAANRLRATDQDSLPPPALFGSACPRFTLRIHSSQSQIAVPVEIPQGPNGSPSSCKTFLIFNNLTGLISGVYFERAKMREEREADRHKTNSH